MPVTRITLERAADLIQAATITRHHDHPASVRLDLDHPIEGKMTTIQAGSDVYLVRHNEAGVPA